MGKQLDTLRKLIKEEFELALNEKNSLTEKENLDYIVDYLLSDEDLNEENNPGSIKGRPSGTYTLFTLKGNKDINDVKKFLKRVQSLIAKKSGRGRKPLNFTDEDIDAFADLLTRPEGFGRPDIVNTISYYKGKPNSYAQKIMNVLGDKKLTGELDKDGNKIEIGKGYIEILNPTKIKKADINKFKDEEIENQDTEGVDADEFEDAADGEIDMIPQTGPELAKLKAKKDEILAKLKAGKITIDQYKKEIGDLPKKIKTLEKSKKISIEDDEDEETMVNEDLVRLFQKRAGLLNG